MSTRSSARNLFPPFDNPELTIRGRTHTDPTLLNNSKMAAEGPSDLPVPDLQTMEELCQPSLNGRGGPITSISIQETNFRLKNNMIQQVRNSCQFHGMPGDDANKHLDIFLHVTQSIKVNRLTDDALHLYLFPHSLTHHATAWFDRLPRNSINTFEQMAKMFLGKYFPPSMVTKLRNEITNFRQCPDESLFEAWEYYSLWEVIINGDSVISRVVVDGVAQPVTVLTAEQKLARKNELKARDTLLIAPPDKHQLKFNSHKDAKTLMEAIEKYVNLKFLRSLPSEWKTHTLIWRNKANLEEHSHDDLFNSLKIYETEVRQSSSPSNPTHNLAFVSSSNTNSTTDSVSAATSVSAVCAKLHVSSHPNIDSLSNAVIFSFFASQYTNPQLDNKDLKQIDVDDLKEIDLRWQMAMLTMRARRYLQKMGRNLGGVAEPHRRTAPVETSTSNALVSQCDGIGSYDWSYQAEEEPANFTLMAITSSSSSDNEENIIVLKNKVEARDNFIITLKRKLKQAETERDDLKLKFKKFQSSSKSLTELIASQTNNKHCLGYLSSEDDSESVSLTSPSDRLSPSGRYHAVPPPITGNFMPLKADLVFNTAPLAVESDHSAFNVQVSPAKPAQVMSHTTKLMAPIIEDWVSDSEDESEPNNPQSVSVQPIEIPILAATPKPTIKTSSSGKRKNKKTCFVCRSVDHLIKDCNFYVKPQTKPTPRNSAHRGCNKQYALFTKKYPQKHKVPAVVLPKSKPVYVTTVRQVSADVPKIMKSRPRPAHPLNKKSNPSIRRYKTHNQFSKTSNSSLKVTAAKVSVGNPQYALKDKGVIDSGYSRHMIGNMSYLSNFQELNGGYVAFGGNPNGGKISGKGKIKLGKLDFKDVYFVKKLKFNLFSVSEMCDTKNKVLFTDSECLVLSPDFRLPDENQVLLRVPRENNMYNVNLKDIVPSGDLTCLFGKAIINESNLWYRRLGHVNFKTINKLVKGNLVRGLPTKAFENQNTCVACMKGKQHRAFCTGPLWLFDIDSITRTMNYQPVTAGNQSNSNAGDATFDGKEHDAEKPESAVNLSPSSSALSGEQDDMTKNKDKGKSPVDYFTGNKDFNAVFDDFSEDSSNDVSAASPIVPTAGKNYSYSTNPISVAGPIVPVAGNNYSNSTNPISVVGPSNSNSSPTHGQSSLRDTYLPPDMVEREDIVYSDHENVSAEADFNNLETSITVSPIPITRTHNAHPISQIIGNQSSTTQTRSMARITRNQGRISQILNEDFHTCMFACFLSQEEPKRVHQASKIQVGLKLCRKSFFSLKCRKFGSWLICRMEKEQLVPNGFTEIKRMKK
nr:ribonuclease H-like domain-containing protein [Tanacetum cinerariifolium]